MDKIKEIALVLARTDDEVVVAEFLKSLLTPKELGEISSRWELTKMLMEGTSQRKISEKLGLSLCKITRGSKELKKDPSYFRQMIDKYSELC